MYGVKGRLNRAQKALSMLEKSHDELVCRQIARLGYNPVEVLGTLPMENQTTRARLLVFLDYEELTHDYLMSAITELQYACAWYPDVVVQYLNYLLQEGEVPPLAELEVYREVILEYHPEQKDQITALERRWKACLNET